MFNLSHWRFLCDKIKTKHCLHFGIDVADNWFGRLYALHYQSWRKFHSIERVGNLLKMLDGQVGQNADDLLTLKMATWFHIADFVPGRVNNERKSRLLFQECAREMSLPKQFSTLTCRIILAPTTNTMRTADGILFTDMLRLFCTEDWGLFCDYQDQIREEHTACGHSSESVYRRQNPGKLRRIIADDNAPCNNSIISAYQWLSMKQNIEHWLQNASS